MRKFEQHNSRASDVYSNIGMFLRRCFEIHCEPFEVFQDLLMQPDFSFPLPIDVLRDEIARVLPRRNVIIQADTGTGKSTRVPLWARTLGRVLVIEPRRVACTSLAGFVAESLSTSVGKQVGYAIKFDHRFTENTEIVFATPGVVLRWFSENKLADFDVVMIDEFHERRAEMDLLAALLLKHEQHRLIVTSATLDAGKLATYFDAECLKSVGRSYGVTMSHHARDPQFMPTSRDLDVRIKALVVDALARGGDVLVFLPGKKEINQCQAILKGIEAEVIPLHASVSDHDRHRALHPSSKQTPRSHADAQSDYVQRVVLATNVAETSLTIPGIVTVIDSGLERRTHQRNGRTALALHAISNASAKQRAGRAGRVAEGYCDRMYGKHAPLEAFTPPELEREELTETMLAAAACGYPLNTLPLLSVLPEKSWVAGMQRLRAMGAVDDAGLITAHGHVLYPLPIDALFAHLISGMKDKSHQEAMCDLAAMLQTPQKVWTRKGGDESLDTFTQWNKYQCDVVTSLAVIREEQPDVIDVDALALKEAKQLSASLRDALALPQREVASRFKREAFLNNVIEVAPELVFVRRERRQQAFGNGMSEAVLSRDSDFPDKGQAAIIFDQFHLAGKGSKQTTSYATCMAPISLTWIAEAGLGEEQIGERQEQNGQFVDLVKTVYAGRVVSETARFAEGDSLISAFAERILSGDLIEGAGEAITRQVTYWNLYQSLDNKASSETVNAQVWLQQALVDLGVESAEDLALLDSDDLHFEGIPEWEFDDFAQKYPLMLQLAQLNLTVEYNKAKRTVILHHHSGLRKEGPKRWELPAWQGWRVQYKKASRVVDVK